jgi:hypothetical protein
VPKRLSVLAITLYLFTTASAWGQDGWTRVVDSRPVSPGSSVVESAWTSSRPPGTQHDQIAVRRFSRAGNSSREQPVLFYLPGTNMNGQVAVRDERYNLWLYLAARGVDVYTMDYRTNRVAADSTHDLSFMAGWTYGVFLDDIAAAIQFAKSQSGRERVFLSGFSRGVSLAYLYAARRWQADLCGLIMLDGGLKNPARTQAADMSTARTEMMAQQRFASDLAGRTGWEGRQELMRRAAAQPPGPATDGKSADAADQLAAVLYAAWGPGVLANPVDGYSDPRVLATLLEGYDRFYPTIQEIEGRALADFDDHPDLTYDDRLNEVAVPVIVFNGTGMGLQFLLSGFYTPSLLATKDVTVNLLEGYGHLDVIAGTRAQQDVFEPTRRWIEARTGCRR